MQLWLLIGFLGRLSLCAPAPADLQGRRCVFLASSRNSEKVLEAGNVNGSIQHCAQTHCCMGFFWLVNGQPSPDLLGCELLEKSCPESSCSASAHSEAHYITCVCSSDFCNRNITWSPEAKQPQRSQAPDTLRVAVIPIGALIVLITLLAAVKWRHRFRDCEGRSTSSHEGFVTSLCSCDVSDTSEIDLANMELQKVVARGHFACVWQGRHQGAPVALKLFPAASRHKFTQEKEVYGLPLMVHSGIARFLGAGRRVEGGEWVLVLELATHGSLNSFLSKTTHDWASTVKLSQSLAQGLAYLHSDLDRNGVHKPAVAHRDLSSNNVLVRADGTCALCDFGCATILRCCCARQQWQPHSGTSQGSSQVGTLRYMSPEILEACVNLCNGHYLMQGDVYALGLLLWELWMRCSDLFTECPVPEHSLPYGEELGASPSLGELVLLVSERRERPVTPNQWGRISQGFSLQEILEDCWDHDPQARLTAQCAANRLASLPSCSAL